MKYRRLQYYTGIFMILILCASGITGCASVGAENTEESAVEETEESSADSEDLDAEEYFNSLLSKENEYQSEPDSSESAEAEESSDAQADSDSEEADVKGIAVGTLDKDNGFLEAIPMGETCRIDLNNDGREDTITYKAVVSDIAEYGTTVETFAINGGDYKYTLYLSDQGIHIQDPDLTEYYITDINTRDSYKEIAILDHGANGTPYTYFIRFVGNGTYCLGYVPYFPDDEHFVIKGDGSVESAYDLTLLLNWQAPAVWLSGSDQMLSSNLKMRTPDVFYPYEDQNEDAFILLKDIEIYTSRDLKSTATTLKASDTAVTFTQTDNEHWVYVKQDDEGAEGWMYMENKDTVVSGTNKYHWRDVFSSL